MAAEFFGTCQICGREQKAHPHAIAKHGYTIRHGWQMGECFGSGAAPYQKSNDRILAAIESAKRYIVQTQDQIAKLRTNPLRDDGTAWAMYSEKRFGDERMGAVTLVLNAKGRVDARDNRDNVVHLPTSDYADSVDATAGKIAARQIASLKNSIRETEAAIPYMQQRYDDWKPAELRPVTAADRAASAPKVHMKAAKGTFAICSSPRSSGYKMTTEDRTKVTCAACLKELARQDDLPRLKAEQAEKDRLRAIKSAERDIKLYQKWIKGGGSHDDLAHWNRLLESEQRSLAGLHAAAPAQ